MIPVPQIGLKCAFCKHPEDPDVFMVGDGVAAICEQCVDRAAVIIASAKKRIIKTPTEMSMPVTNREYFDARKPKDEETA